MTEQEETIILEAREILARYINCNPVLSCWQAVLDYCAISIRGEVERFHVLYLDRKNRLISDECLAIGTVDHVPVYPREIAKRVLLLNASALIIVHNHPSGDPTPSSADIRMTQQIAVIAESMGISVHDHLIVGRHGHASLKSLQLI